MSENKLKELSQQLKTLHTEFETRFQDFTNIQLSLDVFSIFNVDPKNACAELQQMSFLVIKNTITQKPPICNKALRRICTQL